MSKEKSFEKLYRSQCEMHETIRQKLREVQKVCANLRGEVMMQKEQNARLIKMLNDFGNKINKEFGVGL